MDPLLILQPRVFRPFITQASPLPCNVSPASLSVAVPAAFNVGFTINIPFNPLKTTIQILPLQTPQYPQRFPRDAIHISHIPISVYLPCLFHLQTMSLHQGEPLIFPNQNTNVRNKTLRYIFPRDTIFMT